MSDDYGFESHKHPAVVHEHYHWHVTHNFSEQAQSFEHLASHHSHVHDHAELDEEERPLVPPEERYVSAADVLGALEGAHQVLPLALVRSTRADRRRCYWRSHFLRLAPYPQHVLTGQLPELRALEPSSDLWMPLS